MRLIIASALILLWPVFLLANAVSGTVSDEQGQPLPYANVYVKNSTYGVTTNIKGFFFLPLKEGRYTIVFSYLGFESQEREVLISADKPVKIDIRLRENVYQLKSTTIVAVEKDKAAEIMEKVRGRRKSYLDAIQTYSCHTYIKTSIEKELVKPGKNDTLALAADSSGGEDFSTHLKKQGLNLIESQSRNYYRAPSTFKTTVMAYHDYVTKRRNTDNSMSASVGFEYGEADIAPIQYYSENSNIIYRDLSDCDFNFYDNSIAFPALVSKPMLSPIAAGSALSYRYRILESFVEDGLIVYKIDVRPLFPNEALFEGSIYIQDSTWALVACDLAVNKASLLFCREFRIIQNYTLHDNGVYLPVRREFNYVLSDGRYDILGNTKVYHSDYQINPQFPPRFFGNELISYEVEAFDRDSSYWAGQRPAVLQENELDFIRRSDSIQDYYASDEYFHRIDSIYNHINWYWFWLTGVGHRNRARGNEYYISGLFEQVNPFGIGGYRHRLPGSFSKDFRNGYTLETRGFIDYGFKNQDVKGNISAGLTYLPLKFMRTTLELGDFYDRVNDYASFEQVFSRSNYVRTKTLRIAQRMEIVNGLFAELSFTWCDQNPITGLELEKWSQILFGELNEPSDFKRYIRSEIRLDMKYRIRQKYIIRQGRKIVLGTEFPELRFTWRKGIPGLFNSEVDFDYLELGFRYFSEGNRFGYSNISALAGSFVNSRNLRLLEYKYFRGSDLGFFSDPSNSFQLLGPMLSTSHEYLRVNFIHHFDGVLLSKIPLISYLKLSVAAGGGTLLIPNNDFRHFEAFAGLERAVRIKKQLFRFGIYAVTADNSLDPADFTLKFGMDFFNTFSNRWNY